MSNIALGTGDMVVNRSSLRELISAVGKQTLVARKGLSEEMTFRLRLEWKCKGPGAATGMVTFEE